MKISQLVNILSMILLAVGAVILIWLGMSLVDTPPPVVLYAENGYTATDGCPGDRVTYELGMHVNKPSVLFVVSSFLRPGPNGDTIAGSKIGETFVTVIPTSRAIVDRDVFFVIPDLPPGDYVRVVAAGTFGEPSEPAIREQPFTVRDDCER